jgi:putative phosphonate catabolism associated alcohol dehydrogenase
MFDRSLIGDPDPGLIASQTCDGALTMESLARACIFDGPGLPLRLERFALPALGPGEVLVRIKSSTLCGSDLHTYEGRRTTPVPTVLGHEVIGTIAEFGRGERAVDLSGRALEVGDRVTWSIAASCGDCFYCARDLPQKCDRLFKYGHERCGAEHTFSGGLADVAHLVTGTSIARVPEDLPDAVACPASCATATVAGALRLAGGCAGESVLIQGAGLLGLTASAMARASGARQIIVCDPDPARRELATRFGADRAIDSGGGGDQLDRVVHGANDGRGVDLALEFSGSSESVEIGLQALRIGGQYILVGAVFPGPAVALDVQQVVRRMLTIRGLHNYAPRDLEAAVAFLAKHHQSFPFGEVIGGPFRLEEAEAAFDHAIEKRPLRVMVVP